MKSEGRRSKSDLPMNRFVFALLGYLPLAPLFAGVLYYRHLYIPLTVDGWHTTPDIALAIVVYFAFVFLYFLQNRHVYLVGWMAVAVLLIGIEVTPISPCPECAVPLEPMAIRLDGAIARGLDGAKVSCNGVALGRTPIVIPEEEFTERVSPMDQPPRQERLILPEGIRAPFSPKDYTQTYFEKMPSLVPPAMLPRNAADQMESDALPFACAGYWWQFERDGCVGVALGLDFDGDECYPRYSPTFREYRVDVTRHTPLWGDCGITYPSAEPHLARLLLLLHRADYQPDGAWIAHVRRYLNVLFDGLHAAAEEDVRVAPALRAVVQAEFGIEEPVNVSRVWEQVLTRAEQKKWFRAPSPESMAIDLMGDRLNDLVADEFRRQLARSWGYLRTGHMDASWWPEEYRRTLRLTPRFLPVQYAIATLAPPELLDRIIWEACQDSAFTPMLLTYALSLDAPANPLIVFMRNTWHNRSAPYFPGENSYQGHAFVRFPGFRSGSFPMSNHAYVRAMMKKPDVDLRALADMVGMSPTRSAITELRLLAQVHTPHILQEFWLPEPRELEPPWKKELRYSGLIETSRDGTRYGHDGHDLEPTLDALAHWPNPYLDEFLCECLQRELDNDAVAQDMDLSLLFQALARCDTRATWAALDEVWEENPLLPEVQRPAREAILEALAEMQAFLPAFEPWTTRMAQLEDAALRVKAVKVLGRTGTAEAEALLRAWGEDPDISVREAAQAERRRLAQELQDAHALIAGAMHPDELLPPAVAYVWDGESYVPES